jgi:hypothetical protein
MLRQACSSFVIAIVTQVAVAQTPPPQAAPAAASTSINQEKRETAAPTQAQPRHTSANPGAAPPPLMIRIQGEGIKLPDCTAESREGEACKKK